MVSKQTLKVERAHASAIFIINIIKRKKRRKILDTDLQKLLFMDALKKELENEVQEQRGYMGVDKGENQSSNRISSE